jgi:phosphoglycerate kinase
MSATPKTVKELAVRGRTVFLRNDFNVPQTDEGRITDDTRIREALPTFEYLCAQGARVVCASHLGRPKGAPKPKDSLKNVAVRLGELLKKPVRFCPETIGPAANLMKKELKDGEILMLENLRGDERETQNDPGFARELAEGIEVYVNDAFGACHRAHASIDALADLIPEKGMGLLLDKEIRYLSMALHNPPKPYLVILGGAKVSDKIPVIENLVGKASCLLIGGAMAYTFLAAKGLFVGRSKVEPDFIEFCKKMLREAPGKGTRILLPVDHIAAVTIEPEVTVRMVAQGETIPDTMMGLDIGFDTVKLFEMEIESAKLIVWNGPMGVFEIDTFAGGTMGIARAIADSQATSIVGGGDSVAAIHKSGLADKFTHISTGGGASLEFLSGVPLPGVTALTR